MGKNKSMYFNCWLQKSTKFTSSLITVKEEKCETIKSRFTKEMHIVASDLTAKICIT